MVAESADSGSKVDGVGVMRTVDGLPAGLVGKDSEGGSVEGGSGEVKFWT